jgi:hypothetical protein
MTGALMWNWWADASGCERGRTREWARWLRWRVAGGLVLAVVAVGGVGVVVPAVASAAGSPCGTGGVFSTAGSTASCAYSSPGQDTFTVPAGVSSVHVVAIGGQGGDAPAHAGGNPGGLGASVTADLPVGAGTLYVEVAGNGGPATFPDDAAGAGGAGGAGGVNGGAPGGNGGDDSLNGVRPGFGGGGGGGASDLRTATALGSPLLVAAGGGGAAFAGPGCCGDAGHPGTGNDDGAAGGGAGTATAGGDGGAGTPADPADGLPAGGAGQPGSLGAGGAGGLGATPAVDDFTHVGGHGGGGGGGGYYGGGGGGGGGADDFFAGGGGGGSNFVEPSAAASEQVVTDTTGVPSLTVTYTIPPPAEVTMTKVAASPNPALEFQTATVTATVTPTPTGGTVAFDDGSAAITGCAAVALSGATATCQTAGLGVGPHQIAAVYSGSSGDRGSTSSAVNEVVVPDTPANLAKLTVQDVQGSAKFMALPARTQQVIIALANLATQQLTKITPHLTAAQLSKLTAAYEQGVAALENQGYLTVAQAGTLDMLAGHVHP